MHILALSIILVDAIFLHIPSYSVGLLELCFRDNTSTLEFWLI